jgi:hypothetical protein
MRTTGRLPPSPSWVGTSPFPCAGNEEHHLNSTNSILHDQYAIFQTPSGRTWPQPYFRHHGTASCLGEYSKPSECLLAEHLPAEPYQQNLCHRHRSSASSSMQNSWPYNDHTSWYPHWNGVQPHSSHDFHY